MTEITESEILEALRGAMVRAGDEGMTTMEMAEAAGWSEERTRRYIKRLLKDGRLVLGWAQRYRMDQQAYKAPVYRMVA